MTYEEADEMRDKYKHIQSQYANVEPIPFYIRHILIAPKNLTPKLKILKENLDNPIDNKQTLVNLGLLNENLDVYIMGSTTLGQRENEIFQEKNLYEYLSETNQLID